MWQEARANDRRIKELMVDHRKRAERRRAYYESKLGDPQQLIRVIGSSSKVYPDAEQFYYHENPDNLMPWQGNPDIKIDRFDGRSLLDFVPEPSTTPNKRSYQEYSREDREMADELNFERYHDLIEAERLNVSEKERLKEVEEEWTKLLDRHQAKLALLGDPEKKKNNNRGIGFDYGTTKANDEENDMEHPESNHEKESQLLKEVDILQYVDDLTDKDKLVLNEMSSKYGIRSYARLLRVAKKDRDSELRALKKKQPHNNEGSKKSKEGNERKKRKRRRRDRRGSGRYGEEGEHGRYKGRHSPSYKPYGEDEEDEEDGSSGSEETSESDSDEGNNWSSNRSGRKAARQSKDDPSDFVIEFGSSSGSTLPEAPESKNSDKKDTKTKSKRSENNVETLVQKKLTPMEKLKLKMRAGLEQQIKSDEIEKRQKERKKEIDNFQELARTQGLPVTAYLRSDPVYRHSQHDNNIDSETNNSEDRTKPTIAATTKNNNSSTSRYRSPPSSESESRSPSPSPPKRYRSPSTDRSLSRDRHQRDHHKQSHKHVSSSARRRSSSRSRHHHRSRSRSPPPNRRHHRHKSRSRSPSRDVKHSRYRSPSRDKERDHTTTGKHHSSYSSSSRTVNRSNR